MTEGFWEVFVFIHLPIPLKLFIWPKNFYTAFLCGNILKGFGTTGAKTLKGVGKNIAKTGADIAGNMADQASNKMLKVGAQLPVGGQPVKVDKVQGDEVTFADPKNPNAPKTVVKKNSPIVKSALSALIPRWKLTN